MKVKPLFAPSACLTHLILCPLYFAKVDAPTLFLLHRFPYNLHLEILELCPICQGPNLRVKTRVVHQNKHFINSAQPKWPVSIITLNSYWRESEKNYIISSKKVKKHETNEWFTWRNFPNLIIRWTHTLEAPLKSINFCETNTVLRNGKLSKWRSPEIKL